MTPDNKDWFDKALWFLFRLVIFLLAVCELAKLAYESPTIQWFVGLVIQVVNRLVVQF